MNLSANILLLLLFSHSVAANIFWPVGWAFKRSYKEEKQVEGVEERSLICKLDAVLLACSALGSVATTFCASYLHTTPSTSVVYTTIPT